VKTRQLCLSPTYLLRKNKSTRLGEAIGYVPLPLVSFDCYLISFDSISAVIGRNDAGLLHCAIEVVIKLSVSFRLNALIRSTCRGIALLTSVENQISRIDMVGPAAARAKTVSSKLQGNVAVSKYFAVAAKVPSLLED
jgi:hypothetical protein